jgi:hypothetical protein
VGHLTFDELAALVLKRVLLTVTQEDLLTIAGRKRATKPAFASLNDELITRSLETHPPLGVGNKAVRIFRRDGALAAVFDAIFNPSEVGDRNLARLTRVPDPGGIIRDLADLLQCSGHDTLGDLSDDVGNETDGAVTVHLYGENNLELSKDPGRGIGVCLHGNRDLRYLEYPFEMSDLRKIAWDLEAMDPLRYRLEELYAESDVDVESLVTYALLLGEETRIRGPYVSDLWGDSPFELVERRDKAEVPIARFLRTGEIRFRLTASDAAAAEDVRVSWSGHGKRERVAYFPSDPELVRDLMSRAAWKRASEVRAMDDKTLRQPEDFGPKSITAFDELLGELGIDADDDDSEDQLTEWVNEHVEHQSYLEPDGTTGVYLIVGGLRCDLGFPFTSADLFDVFDHLSSRVTEQAGRNWDLLADQISAVEGFRVEIRGPDLDDWAEVNEPEGYPYEVAFRNSATLSEWLIARIETNYLINHVSVARRDGSPASRSTKLRVLRAEASLGPDK